MTYNCNNPSNIKKYTLEDDSKCRERSKTIDERTGTQIDIFQENSLIEVKGYSCEIWRDRTVHQCGSFLIVRYFQKNGGIEKFSLSLQVNVKFGLGQVNIVFPISKFVLNAKTLWKL